MWGDGSNASLRIMLDPEEDQKINQREARTYPSDFDPPSVAQIRAQGLKGIHHQLTACPRARLQVPVFSIWMYSVVALPAARVQRTNVIVHPICCLKIQKSTRFQMPCRLPCGKASTMIVGTRGLQRFMDLKMNMVRTMFVDGGQKDPGSVNHQNHLQRGDHIPSRTAMTHLHRQGVCTGQTGSCCVINSGLEDIPDVRGSRDLEIVWGP